MSVEALATPSLSNSHQARLEAMTASWAGIRRSEIERDIAQVDAWTSHLTHMQEVQDGHIAASEWVAGARTLLEALSLHRRETLMVAGLAWLLEPDGYHRLGDRVLNGFLNLVNVTSPSSASLVQVVREESRLRTRADMVVYGTDWTVVVEAKVDAGEQLNQLDRTYSQWAHEPGSRFVFLTHDGREPQTARLSGDEWQRVKWSQIAGVVRKAMTTSPVTTPGVHEYLETLELNHCA